ncbi:hypothetical protein AAKU55_002230 [Oxalobacteraceae bacterium GrIS 1.11]
MAIERIPLINFAPQVAQRLDLSNVTPLAPASVGPLVQLAPYSTAIPDAAAAPGSYLSPDVFDKLATASGGATAQATPHDSSAMQVNQLFFSRQLVWQAPDPALMAASWRVMVRTYGEQRAAMDEQARGLHMPGNLFMAEFNPTVLREGPRPPLMMEAEAWRFAVYGWNGQRLMLRVLASDPEQAPAPKRRRGKVALRLELLLPDAGRVVIQMEPLADGILLELAASDPAALRHVRLNLSELAQAIGRCGVRVLRCRLSHELHAARVHNNYPMQAAAASLSLPIFRAMAEVAVLLSRRQTPAAQAELAWAQPALLDDQSGAPAPWAAAPQPEA